MIERIGPKYGWPFCGIALTVCMVISAACSQAQQPQPQVDAAQSPAPTFQPIPQIGDESPELGTPVVNETPDSERPIFSDATDPPLSGGAMPDEGDEPVEPDSIDVYADLPKLVGLVTLPSGLRVGWTEETHEDIVDTAYIESQWIDMQACLGVSAAPPLIVLTQGAPKPLTPTDDVLRYIDGSITATASLQADNSILQLQIDDLDRSGRLGSHGSNLRQITARHVWFANDLNERDYPYQCARDAN